MNEHERNCEDSKPGSGPVQQQSAEGDEQATGATELSPAIAAERSSLAGVKSKCPRKDKGRLHAVRHGVTARFPMEALRHLGEDGNALRRLERRFRAELKPRGLVADLIFDRFWAAYLRCLLAARVEASAFLAADRDTGNSKAALPALIQADLPTLVTDAEQGILGREAVPPDVLQQLLLVQRYDRHFSREMYQALALLLVMRATGQQGLEQSIAKMFGAIKEL